MKLTGSQMIVKALEMEGVERVFGIPGGAVIPLYDALYEAPFRVVLTRHEQAACHAAEGYARASGKVGVCIATSGPGATNIVTGLANAHMDSVPLVVITGQVHSGFIGTDAFQEADIYGCTLPIVKHSFLVRTVEELPQALRGAFVIAATGRPGPVLVDVPSDVQKEWGVFHYPEAISFPGYPLEKKKDFSCLERAVKEFGASPKPVILAGGGVITAGASQEILELAEKVQAPVATTLMGKGAFPESHPLSLGVVGMHGTPQANLAISQAQVILALGTRFSDRSTGNRKSYASGARVIHVDLDEAELSKNISASMAIMGDVKEVVGKFFQRVLLREKSSPWVEQIEKWREEYRAREPESLGELRTVDVVRAVREIHGPQGVLTTEVGQHQMWASLHYQVDFPRKFLSSGGLGTMGFGLPAAVGAAFANPGKRVVCLGGDGSLLMNIQELETLGRYNLPVTVVLCNNGALGMVRQWQDLFFDQRFSGTVDAPRCNFVEAARAFGVEGVRVQHKESLKEVLSRAFRTSGPSLVECVVSQEENVYPMVPPGGNIQDFLFYPSEKPGVSS